MAHSPLPPIHHSHAFPLYIPSIHSLYITDDVLCMSGKQGNAKYGTSTSVIYNELEGLTNLLKYSAIPIGCCGIVLHPQWGRGAYPVTLFTTAPLDVLKKASLTLNGSHSSLALKSGTERLTRKVSHAKSHTYGLALTHPPILVC